MALSKEIAQIREMRDGIQNRFWAQHKQVTHEGNGLLEVLKEAETLALLTRQLRATVELENALRGN